MIEIKVDYITPVNYALHHSGIVVCKDLAVTNMQDHAIENFRLVCDGDYILPCESAVIPSLAVGKRLRFKDVDIVPDAAKLLSLTETIVTTFRLQLKSDDEVLAEKLCEVTLLPFDFWSGTTTMPQTLASFVTPNHPAISSLLLQVSAKLKALTGSSSLSEYQSGNPNDVRQQVAAVFATLHEQGIVYRALPASFETKGQRITMPDQVISQKLGNCIELTLLFATLLEVMGIHSIVVMQSGHAYLGVWLVDDYCPYSVSDDYAYLEKKCSEGIGEMLVLECTQVTHENSSFEEALKMAQRSLADHAKFKLFIDLRRCRLEHFLPLPVRVEKDGVWNIQDGVEHDGCEVDVKEHDRYDLSRLDKSQHELTRFDIWDRKLLDLSLRNSLLNLSLHRRAIQFISFDVNRIEDFLQQGDEFCLLPKMDSAIKSESEERLHRSKLLENWHELVSQDILHHRLHSYCGEAESQGILKNIYRAARNAIEETGANSLFLAIGALRWYETPTSATPRFAPLLLLPVEMVYKKGKYYIRTRDEEITLNITLIEFLRQIHNITIPGLDPLPKDASGVDVPLIFAAVRDALKDQKNWDVEEECILGTFSFSKFLMWNDVHNNRHKLLENDIVSSLVANRLTYQPTGIATDLKAYDSSTPPTDVTLPMAADSSQLAAILEAGKGHSFILYGPPGTGKSQTITNLISNALYQGKRVLFVAEKMAALSVVQTRLEKIGLAPFCLELHSNKATKRHVLEQLAKALKVTHIMPPQEYASTAEKIYEERKILLEYIQALHHVDPTDGLSLYKCIVRYDSIDAPVLPDFVLNDALASYHAKEGDAGIETMLGSKLETLVKLVGQPSAHPLKGLRVNPTDVTTPEVLKHQLTDAKALLEACENRREELQTTPELRLQILRDCEEGILNLDPEKLRDEWRRVKSKWFIPRYFAKKNYLAKLRLYNKYISEVEVEPLLDKLAAYDSRRRFIEDVGTCLHVHLGIDSVAGRIPDTQVLADALACLERWISHTDMMRDWFHWSEYRQELIGKGLDSVVRAMEARECSVSTLRQSFFKSFYRKKTQDKMSTPLLATFEGALFDERVKHYKQLADEYQLLTQKEIYARLAANIPRVTENIDHSSEIGLLNRNISSGGRGLSLRDLFDQIPTLLPRLCPCMLMSPMSVAQYLDLAAEKFDLVVFDEASQMPTSEAVGAIARGKALVVVGDPKQMPPTSFFSSTNVDEDDASIDDMESILEDCRTLEIPSLQLNWHYRSQHESLIAFSNNEYYDGDLITFPSVDDRQAKVSLVPVDGCYDKGNKRTNRAEAEAIVKEIVRRLRDEQLHGSSIGVIAFSVVQQGLIEDLLQDQLDKNQELKELADSLYEPIFVKNLENVQGDERDVILFSVGYGPDKDGRVSMNFGPLNNAGGERRLNVAVSRARQEMIVFSTLRSSQIDLRRTQARGVEGLKHFLEYAETQSLASSAHTVAEHQDATIAEQIALELGKRGYAATTCVGRSHFKVSVAISDPQDPNIYKLGILLDGELYRDTQTTRDREIVQPAVLASLRWKTMRVWSVDWFNNRERVLQRILERLRDDAPTVEAGKAPNACVFDISREQVVEQTATDATYEEYRPTQGELAIMDNHELMDHLIAREQPITFHYLCRRVAAMRELPRVTPTLQKELASYVGGNLYTEADRDGRVIWLSADDSRSYKGYRQAAGRDIVDVPLCEIKNAILESVEEQLSLLVDNLTLIVAKKLGFTHRGANIDSAFKDALFQLIQNGTVECVDGKLRMARA